MAEFETEIQARFEWPGNNLYTWNARGPYAYDAMWAIGLTLNKSVEMLKTKTLSDVRTRRLEDFTYDDSDMANMFLDILKDIRFDGISVR